MERDDDLWLADSISVSLPHRMGRRVTNGRKMGSILVDCFRQGWRAKGRLHEFFFNVLWIALPLGIFGYLGQWHSPWELLVLILLMSLIPLFFMQSPAGQ
jgi:hypothetical protein